VLLCHTDKQIAQTPPLSPSGDSLHGYSALAIAEKPCGCCPCEANRCIAADALNERCRFRPGRLPREQKGGAKPPLSAAWAGADARCPFRGPL
jgi:hypothetical protein